MTHYCSLCFDAIALPGLCESCEQWVGEHPGGYISDEEQESIVQYVDFCEEEQRLSGGLS